MALTARQPIDDELGEKARDNAALSGHVANNNVEKVSGVEAVKKVGDTLKIKLDTKTFNVLAKPAANDNVKTEVTPVEDDSSTDITTPTSKANSESAQAPATVPPVDHIQEQPEINPVDKIPTTPSPITPVLEQPNANPPATAKTPPPTTSPEQGTPPPEHDTQKQPADEQPKTALPTGAAKNNAEGENTNKLAESTNKPATGQPEQAQPEQPNENPPTTAKTPPPTTSPEQGTPPPEQGTQPSTTLDQPPKPDKSPAKQSPSEQAVPPNDTTPPKVPKEELGKTGPHSTTPNTIAPTDQPQAANELAQPRGETEKPTKNAGGTITPGVAGGIGAGIANKMRSGAEKVKNAPENLKKSIVNSIQSDRSRKKKLKKERKKLGTELAALDGKVDGMKGSPPMRILKVFARPVYDQLTSLSFGRANLKDQPKTVMLQTNLATLNTIKALLYTLVIIADYGEAVISVARTGVATVEFIVGFFIIACSPILAIPIFIFKFGSNTGKISKALTTIIKEDINPMIKKVKELLESIKKKVGLRKRIIEINQLLNGTGSDRKEDANNTKKKEEAAAAAEKNKKTPEPTNPQVNNSQPAT